MSCPTCCKSIEIVQQLEAENQRLKQCAQLVETAVEAEECNGETHDHWTAITLNSSWFKKARALLAAGDAEVQQ